MFLLPLVRDYLPYLRRLHVCQCQQKSHYYRHPVHLRQIGHLCAKRSSDDPPSDTEALPSYPRGDVAWRGWKLEHTSFDVDVDKVPDRRKRRVIIPTWTRQKVVARISIRRITTESTFDDAKLLSIHTPTSFRPGVPSLALK